MHNFGIITLQEKRRGRERGKEGGENKRKQLTKIQNYKSVLKDGMGGGGGGGGGGGQGG